MLVLHFPTFAADWKVVRSCTDDVDINMFMVDHVCMSEGGGRGKMCFCEEDECNHASSTIHTTNSFTTSNVNLMKKVYPLYLLYHFYYNNNICNNFLVFLFPSFASMFLFRIWLLYIREHQHYRIFLYIMSKIILLGHSLQVYFYKARICACAKIH